MDERPSPSHSIAAAEHEANIPTGEYRAAADTYLRRLRSDGFHYMKELFLQSVA